MKNLCDRGLQTSHLHGRFSFSEWPL